MKQLREYQSQVKEEIYLRFLKVMRLLAVLATGGGKSVISGQIVFEQMQNGGVAVVVHRKELVAQLSTTLADFGIKHRVIAQAGAVAECRARHLEAFGLSFVADNAHVAVVMAQTAISDKARKCSRNRAFFAQCKFAILDEGHHYVQGNSWSNIYDILPADCKVLQVTATPQRADGTGLGEDSGGFAQDMVLGKQTRWLIDNGYLSDYKYYAPESDLNLDDVKTGKDGDYTKNSMAVAVGKSKLVGDVVEHYQRFAFGKRTIVFATSVKVAEELEANFNSIGVKAVELNGKTDAGQRARSIKDFTAGRITVLINVDLFDEGFDVPAVECVILARPTKSLGKYLQMVGRSLRVMEGKTHAIIIDPVRNVKEHGLPCQARSWTLKGRDKRDAQKDDDSLKLRFCAGCMQPYSAVEKVCPFCGKAVEFTQRAAIEQVDGDLTELDIDAYRAKEAEVARANMTDDELYNESQRRGVPGVGVRQFIKRGGEKREASQAMAACIARWGGLWVEESADWLQRKFYLTFNIDVMSALALGTKESLALQERINASFDKYYKELYTV